MHIASIGIDLGKTTFHLVAVGEQSKVVVRKKCSRKHTKTRLAREVWNRNLLCPTPKHLPGFSPEE